MSVNERSWAEGGREKRREDRRGGGVGKKKGSRAFAPAKKEPPTRKRNIAKRNSGLTHDLCNRGKRNKRDAFGLSKTLSTGRIQMHVNGAAL